MRVIAVLSCLVAVTSLAGAYTAYKQHPDDDLKDFITLMQILDKPRVPEKYKVGLGASPNSFSWKSCGHSSDLVTLDKLEVGPDKIKLPGNVTFSGSGKVNAPLSSPISLSLKIKKKVFIWVDIPCVDNLGSCNYDDACSLLAQMPCPTAFPDCHCPFKPGPVTVNGGTLYIDDSGIPTWLTEGDYQVEATAMYKGKEVFCLQMSLTLG